MNWKKNKGIISVIIFCVCVWCLRVDTDLLDNDGNSFTVEVWEVDTNGYGYKIMQDGRVVIMQPFIPGISGKQYFNDADKARRVGQLVCERLKSGDDFTVTMEDLEKLGIVSFTE